MLDNEHKRLLKKIDLASKKREQFEESKKMKDDREKYNQNL